MEPAPSRLLTGIALVVMTLIWGTTWGAIRIGLQGIPPFTGIALRFAIAGFLLLGVALATHVDLRPKRRVVLVWVTNGLFSFSISYGIVYWAEQWVPSGLSSVLWSTFPFHVAVVAHVLLPQERLTRKRLAGIVLGFAGILVLFSDDFDAMQGDGVTRAAAWLLLSPLAAAIGNVVVKRWGRGMHHLSVTSMPMILTAAVTGALAAVTEGQLEVEWTGASVGALLYLAIFGSAVTFSLYFWLLRHVSATRLSLIAYAIPVVALTFGALALDEPVTPKLLLGSMVVLSGVALASRPGAMRKGENAELSKVTCHSHEEGGDKHRPYPDGN